MREKVPVTVLTGYLGSGKTTLLNNILHGNHGKKIAVIVNDMGEVNVDEALIDRGGFKRTDEKLVSMANGCICCTLREDLIVELNNIVADGSIEHIVIESSGISEPIPIAQSIVLPDNPLGIDLTNKLVLDAVVSIVDVSRFWDNFQSGEKIEQRKAQGDIDEEDRDIRDLLIDQIEFCNVLLLNKCDLLENEKINKIEQLVRKLQPEAKIIRTVQAKIDLKDILDTKLFDMEKISYSAGWLKELELGFQDHVPETEEYGISSFVYRSKLPFDANKFHVFAERNLPKSVTRSKGFVWLAQHSDFSVLFETAGNHKSISPLTYWIATLPKQERNQIIKLNPNLRESWHPLYGDRLTEIVFIGMDMDRELIQTQLDDCIVDEESYDGEFFSRISPYPWEKKFAIVGD